MTHSSVNTRAQTLVYEIDQGRGLRIVRGVMITLLVLGLMGGYTYREFQGLRHREAMDQAQVARNISLGRGFQTGVIRPLALWQARTHSERQSGQRISREAFTNLALYQRETLAPPVYPVMASIPFRLLRGIFKQSTFVVPGDAYRPGSFKPELFVLVPIGLICTVLSGVLVFRIAHRLLDRRAAWLAFILVLMTNALWASAISGRNIAFLGLLFTATLLLMIIAETLHEEERRGLLKWLCLTAAALLTGIGFLTRYSYGLAMLPLIVWSILGFPGRRLPAAAWVTLVFLGLAVPWCVWIFRATGNPFGLAPYQVFQDLSVCPEDFVLRTLNFDSSAVTITQVGRKFLTNAREFFTGRLLLVGGSFVAAVFVLSILHRFRRPVVRRLYAATWTTLLLFAMAESFTQPADDGLLLVVLPVMTLFAAAFFFMMLDRMDIPLQVVRATLTVAFVLVNAAVLVLTLILPRTAIPYPPYWPPVIRFLGETLQPGEVMMTDIAEGMAWYGDRRSVPLTPDINEFYQIHDFVLAGRLKALYLTTETRNRPFLEGLLKGPMESWGQIVMLGAVPREFPFFKTIRPMNNRDQLFLSDTERWRMAGGENEG